VRSGEGVWENALGCGLEKEGWREERFVVVMLFRCASFVAVDSGVGVREVSAHAVKALVLANAARVHLQNAAAVVLRPNGHDVTNEDLIAVGNLALPATAS